MEPKTVDLPHLVRVCEAYVEARNHYDSIVNGSHTQEELRIAYEKLIGAGTELGMNVYPSTVLTLLRRLGEAEEKVKQLEDVIHPPSIAPTGGIFAGLPEHLQPQGIDPAYLRERKAP